MLLTIISFVLVLSIVIIVHEFGHFLAAKKTGVKVEEIGLGFPPRMFAFKKNDREYSLNWIPLGGFVRLKGQGDRSVQSEDSFNTKKVWQRALIMSAGVLMNVILAIVVFSFGFTLGLPSAIGDNVPGAKISDEKIQVYEVVENTPAEKAGLKTGDIIISIDDQGYKDINNLKNYYTDKEGETLNISVKRGGEIINLNIKPEKLDESDQAKMGVSLVNTGIVSFPLHLAVWNGLKATFIMLWQIILGFYNLIKNALISHQISADVAGPVGIAVITGQMAKMGFVYLLEFIGMLSLTLALINFLPLPALDGGHLLFLLIEKIKGSRVNERVENIVHTVGFYLIILLFFVITFRDIIKFNIASSISDFFKNIF
ncbi:MAG: RIP metalloprotease RseP [Patescibacteria group bacterium]|nr:RIP metalloprotease RseP [Patescibacteria group bacterium]